jgi:hypothetical protein
VPERQLKLVEGLRNVFESVMLDLASKLDVDDGTGSTYLDSTLIHWSQECGMDTHGSDSIPIVTMGGAGGYFKTGNFVDYRNQIPAALFKYQTNAFVRYRGLLYNRWMGNVLQAMGLRRSEYESGGIPGYGRNDIYTDFAPAYTPDVVRASSGDPLPVIAG